MAAKRNLRAVSPDEADAAAAVEDAKKRATQSLEQAIEGGVYLEILEAQQRQMARDVKDAAGPAKAAMYRQITLISKEIDQLRLLESEGADGGDDRIPEDEEFDASAI